MRSLIIVMALLCACRQGYAQPTAGLAAYWPLNGNFTDNGPNNISVTNTSVTATTNYTGTANAAMNFNNSGSTVTSYASCATSSAINFTGNFSIDFSFMVPSFPHTMGFFDNCLNTNGYGVWIWNTGALQINLNYKGSNVGTTAAANLVVNTWYHVCCVANGTTMSIYINGMLNNSATIGSGTPSYGTAARFGTMYYAPMTPPAYNGLYGKLDELRIYNRALTATEIKTLSTVTLPIGLSRFSAAENNGEVRLEWATSSEQNSNYFDIQRSTDGSNFSTIGRKTAAGNSSVPITYIYDDYTAKQLSGTVFYRLDMTDKDGSHKYSNTLAVRLGSREPELRLFPNPVGKVLQVSCPPGITGNIYISISSSTGQKLVQQVISAGSRSLLVDVGHLSAGTYFLQLQAGNYSITKPFSKQ